MITDVNGKAVVIEYIDNEIKIIHKNEFESLFVTNFYLYNNNSGDSRYNTMKEYLKKGTKMSNKDAMELLNKVKMGITLWSNVYDTYNLKVNMAYRQDYSHIYELNVLEPMKYNDKQNTN